MENHIHNYYGTVNQYSYDDQKLNLIISKLDIMQDELVQLKDQLTEANTNLDTVNTNLDGIGRDITFLNKKISDLVAAGNGATPAELADLLALGTSLKTKTDNVKTKSADLDAQTDSQEPAEPGPGGEGTQPIPDGSNQ